MHSAVGQKAMPTINGMLKDNGLARLLSRIHNSTSIAVVGSSGNLLYRKHGAEIDAHDVVIRINDPPTDGYEDDVGHEFSIRFAYDLPIKTAYESHQVDTNELTICSVACRPAFIDSVRSSHEVLEVPATWHWQLHANLLDSAAKWPSTGFVALALAVAVAQHVGAPPPSVYGFGVCPPCGKYYDCNPTSADDRAEKSGSEVWHPFLHMKAVRTAWQRQGAIRHMEPSCNGFDARYVLPQSNAPYETDPSLPSAFGVPKNSTLIKSSLPCHQRYDSPSMSSRGPDQTQRRGP